MVLEQNHDFEFGYDYDLKIEILPEVSQLMKNEVDHTTTASAALQLST